MKLLRIAPAFDRVGDSRTRGYANIKAGLLTRPVKLGPRAVGMPEHEIDAIVTARIAGKPDADIRALVQRLHAARIAQEAV